MDKATVIRRLCDMPGAFNTRRDVSMITLIRESGYIEIAERVLEADIEAFLRAHSELVAIWQQHSEDQRCVPAWYIEPPFDAALPDDAGWRVGYYSTVPAECRSIPYPDGYTACAGYVKRTAEGLRTLAAAC